MFKNLLINFRWKGFLSIVLLSLGIFLLSWLAGYSSEVSESQTVLEELKNMVAPLRQLNRLELTALIFFNNSLKAFLTILSGLIFGLGPLIFLTINGSLLGMVIKGAVAQHGVVTAVLSLLPHGILELPSIIVSAALGFRLGIVVFQKILRKDVRIKQEIKLNLLLFAAIILPVLLVAAFVEVFITSLLIGGT